MKKVFICAFFILPLTMPNFCFGQKVDSKIPDEYNFFKIKEQNKRSLSVEKKDTSSDNDIARDHRFNKFWSNRVGLTGDMRDYYKRMQDIYKSKLISSSTSVCGYGGGCGDCCYPSSWTYFGPQTLKYQNLGKIHAIWIDPVVDLNILVGSEGGLFKTVDGGINWTCITDFCLPLTGVYGIAVEPNSNNQVIYVGTGYNTGTSHNEHSYGYGVFKTTDGGSSWTRMNIPFGNPEDGFSSKVVINPAANNNVYVIAGSQVFKTVNATAPIPLWTTIFNNTTHNPNKLPIIDLEVLPVIIGGVASDEVYISSASKRAAFGFVGLPETFIWGDPTCVNYCETVFTAKAWQFISPRNSTALTSWLDLTPSSLPSYNPITRSVAVCITSNSVTIACQTGNAFQPSQINIYRKLLNSTTWNNIATTNAAYGFPFEVSSADDRIMYFGGDVLYKSIDNGATFNPLWGYWEFIYNPSKPGGHPDVRAMAIHRSSAMPGSNDVLFWGDDGGIGKSVNGGLTSLNLNGKGLQLTQFQGISNSETFPNLVYGGTQDNGLFDNKIQSWSVYPYGDGYQCVTDDNQNPPKAYSTVNGTILETTNGQGIWLISSLPCPTGASCWDVPLYIDANSNFYLCSRDVFKRSGSSWINISNLNLPNAISDMVVSLDGNTAYISYEHPLWGAPEEKRIYKITNLLSSSPVLIDITAGLTGVDWAGITNLSTNDAGTIVWACFGGLWDINKKVFKYENSTWAEYGQGLQNCPANAIEYLKNSNDMLFLGTDDGVYYRNRDMSQWKEFRCGLPKTIVSGLRINYATSKLRAATHARGIWETSINLNSSPSACSSNLSATATVSNQTPSLVNLSNGITVPVLSTQASVNINLANYCDGQSACNTSQVTWKIFRDGGLIQSGNGTSISFNGLFRGPFSFMRHTYRVEVNIICGASSCQALIYNFRGI